jgi:hypothetical protein
MDRNQLKISLQPFVEACSNKGKPLSDIYFVEAYPGDASTSFRVKVKANWFEGKSCWEIINFLFDVLWETSDEDIRQHIFSIEVLDSNNKLQGYHKSSELENKVQAHA